MSMELHTLRAVKLTQNILHIHYSNPTQQTTVRHILFQNPTSSVKLTKQEGRGP